MSQEPIQPQYQSPVQPPAPKKRRGKFFAIGCGSLAALVVLIIIIAIAASANSGGSTPTSSATQGTTSTQAPATPTHALKWTTTHTFTGNGTKKTATFTAPDDWKILYTCTYQNTDGITSDGLLGVTVYNSADNTPLDVAVNATCKNGVAKTTGETEEHQGGQVYLSIDGIGDWTVQIQELQ